jgi:hypothetical protein
MSDGSAKSPNANNSLIRMALPRPNATRYVRTDDASIVSPVAQAVQSREEKVKRSIRNFA